MPEMLENESEMTEISVQSSILETANSLYWDKKKDDKAWSTYLKIFVWKYTSFIFILVIQTLHLFCHNFLYEKSQKSEFLNNRGCEWHQITCLSISWEKEPRWNYLAHCPVTLWKLPVTDSPRISLGRFPWGGCSIERLFHCKNFLHIPRWNLSWCNLHPLLLVLSMWLFMRREPLASL